MTYELRPQVLDDALAYLTNLIAGYPPMDPRTAEVRAQIDAIRKAQVIILASQLPAPMLVPSEILTKELYMTEAQKVLEKIRATIATMPPDNQRKIEMDANLIRRIASQPDGFGMMAVALVDAELATSG